MKILKFLAITLVVVLGFSSCNPKEKHDHSSDLAGTWTCLTADFAEAMVINEDGSVVSTILIDGNYLENMEGNIVVENDIVTLSFEDGTKVEGHFDIIPGMAFSIYNEDGGRMTFNYCEEDLSEEIIGMWVCNDTPNGTDSQMSINTYNEDGTNIFTGVVPGTDSYIVNETTKYNVVGDLMFKKRIDDQVEDGTVKYIAARLKYAPKATTLGDIMNHTQYISTENGKEEIVISYLRVTQGLNLPGKKYEYSNAYVSNVKALDEEIELLGSSINFADIDASYFDMASEGLYFDVEFTETNIMKYTYNQNGQSLNYEVPFVVEDNILTIKMSERGSALKDITFYAFQDADDCQMHLYMHTDAFVNFFTNEQAIMLTMMQVGDIINDAAAVEEIHKVIDEAVESINISIVMKSDK